MKGDVKIERLAKLNNMPVLSGYCFPTESSKCASFLSIDIIMQ